MKTMFFLLTVRQTYRLTDIQTKLFIGLEKMVYLGAILLVLIMINITGSDGRK